MAVHRLPHTVYFFFGSIDSVYDFIQKEKFDVTLSLVTYDALSIDQAKELRARLTEHTDEGNATLIRIEKMSPEVQNTLLKICEEINHRDIIFSFPQTMQLIDTLLSRGVVRQSTQSHLHFNKTLYTPFLEKTSAVFNDRMTLYTTLVKEYESMENKTLVRYILEDLFLLQERDQKTFQENGRVLTEALKLLEYQKSSPKQIFEYVALMIK